MKLLIKGGRVVDPASGRDQLSDIFISDGRVVEAFREKPETTIDATGLVVAPGLIDLSARLREPGYEYKATLESEMDAAVAGGVTSLACPPDTDPPLDEPGLVDMLRRRAKVLARARVYPIGALTVKLAGERLTEMAELAEAGCVAFSQANAPLPDTQVLWRALQYAATFGFPVWLRTEDRWLAHCGVAHDGEVATRLGLPGIPAFAETIALGTVLQLVRTTGSRVHVCRLSTAIAVEMIRAAKKEGLPVSCDVGIHHVHLSEMDLGYFDAHCRLEPPLRSQRDREALAAGLADGTIDCAVSDHTPVDEDQKQMPFAEAEPGATGLELLLPLVLKWGAERKLPLVKTLARITSDAARILGVSSGRLEAGAPADLVLFDPEQSWRLTPEMLRSQGKNTPFLGYEMAGRVRTTIVAGNVVYQQA
ncbi:MAG: dihydroorotase [Betaproteobacteria bacterium]|nr:dihydroorotase [Betaproteobacteria bacterium]MSQ88125.1 dihydroorotase [Betaproteobacteria bacterium]